MNKKNLQIISFFLALIPIFTGLLGFLGINDPIYKNMFLKNNAVLLDSNLRFFSGVWLSLGIFFLSIIKNIDTEKNVFRMIWIAIFIGGIGRLISVVVYGFPPIPFIVFTILEILGAPFFIFWQNKISKNKLK